MAHPRSRRPLVWTLALTGVLALGLAADMAWSVREVSGQMRQAREALERAASQLEAGDAIGARASFREAAGAASAATGGLAHLAPRVAGALPWLGDDLAAARTLSEVAGLASDAGVRLADAAGAAGWDGSSIPGYVPGRLDLAVLERAVPPLEEAAGMLRRASELAGSLGPEGKLAPIGEAITTVQDLVGDRSRQIGRAAALARLLPGLLGADGPRTYAIVMMTLSDARGSGGYPGSFGGLRIEDGRFELEQLAPTAQLGRVRPVEASDDVARRYARFGGLTHFISSTYSPDWPTAAQMWMRMWEASGREPLDGVIGADSVWMSYVLEAIGTVRSARWPGAIGADNVSRILDADTMRTLDHERSDAWQAAIASALWQAMVTRPVRAEAFGNAVSRATAERHLEVYSADPNEEALLETLGASGRLDMPENPLMVSWSGFVGSRTGYFVEKAIEYRATLREDGIAQVTIELTLTNTAPTGPEGILLGQGADNFDVGAYAAAASVYLPTRPGGYGARWTAGVHWSSSSSGSSTGGWC